MTVEKQLEPATPSLPAAIAIVTALFVVAGVGCGAWGQSRVEGGWLAAVLAGLVCWVAGVLAILLVSRATRANAVSMVLATVVVRTLLALAFGLAAMQVPLLVDAGVLMILVVNYLVGLAVETWLSVRIVSQRMVATEASAAKTLGVR